MKEYAAFHRRSLEDREAFWLEQARLIDWRVAPRQACDDSRAPFVTWFAGGKTNLCHNAVDRHLDEGAERPALICVSTETGQEQVYSFRELHREVQCMAAILVELGVRKGDLVLIYMPMIAEAVFTMLACARIGAIHSVVFGGFGAAALAARIDDARPRVIVSADAGSRNDKVIPYKPALDEAIGLAAHGPQAVLMVDRGLAAAAMDAQRDWAYALLREKHKNAELACEWVDATHPSYILYTSGTTGKPKGVQRDTGGYAVALAASMKYIFCGGAGETFFSTSDIGWVVGHSYIVYGPLLAGMATILYEGLPTRPDAGIWWRLVEQYKVAVMFSALTAIRLLKRQDPSFLTRYDLSSLRALFLAGEPLDESTSRWAAGALGIPVMDNYWQTETGWPILAAAAGVEQMAAKPGSPGVPMYGYNVKLMNEEGQELAEPGQKGIVVIDGPLPPGCMQTVWGDDSRYVNTYWSFIPGKSVYCTFDWGMRDSDGYMYILGRSDDVINVAGHRLGTREIEEAISAHPNVAEAAVVGIANAMKGQVAVAFVTMRDAAGSRTPDVLRKFELEVLTGVERRLGAVARPARLYVVDMLPKTRSGKILRRMLQAICEGRAPGETATMEDPAALQHLQAELALQQAKAGAGS